jgi:hypothetical protein
VTISEIIGEIMQPKIKAIQGGMKGFEVINLTTIKVAT